MQSSDIEPGWWLIQTPNPAKGLEELSIVEVIQSARKIVLFTHGSKAQFMDDILGEGKIKFLKRLDLEELGEN